MKRLLLLSLMIGLCFTVNAQFINGIFGTISDANGNALPNVQVDIFVACDDSLNSMSSTVYTNPNGFFGDTLYNCVSGTVFVNYACPDGTINQAAQQFTPNNPVIDFSLICQGSQPDTCFVGFTYSYNQFFPDQVNFQSTVSGATLPVSYVWDFGDGSTGTSANPSHIYTQPGLYNVCLEVTDAEGNVCSNCLDVWIQGPVDSCFVDVDWVIDPNDPLTVSFTTTVTGGTGPYFYDWNLGAGGLSNEANPMVTFPFGGSQFGCVNVWDNNQTYCTECFSFTLQEPVDSCDNNLVILQLGLDNFPQETSWDITDGNGNVVASSNGTYAGVPDGTVVTETACLEDGCFVFNIYDTFGDGICCGWGQGFYNLTDANGNLLASGGDFDNVESTGFGFNVPSDSCVFTPPIDTTPVCIDWTLFEWPPSCDITVIDPVCGCDGVTYPNSCYAEACFGIAEWTPGPCAGNGNGNNGGGGIPCDTLTDLTVGFEYFGQVLQNGDWGYAFFGNADGGDPPYFWYWEFSDGSTYTTQDVAHTFPAEDTLQSYSICLTVSDSSQCSVQVCETIVIDSNFSGTNSGNVSEGGNLRPGEIVKSDGEGDPMPDVHIRLLNPAGAMIQETWTDADGNYAFFGLQMGDYYLHVDIPGIPHEPEHFKITPITQTVGNLNFSVGADGVSTTGIEDISFADQVVVYPNPATDIVIVDIQMAESADLSVKVNNLLGQTIVEQNESLLSGRQSFSVGIQGLTPGIYLLTLQSGSEIYTEKVLVQ